MENKTIPVFRIFDVEKAKEFYINWLEFKIDWEHGFEDNSPIYMQISRDGIELHLTEHYGDCCPGAKAFIVFQNISQYHKLISDKNYKYYRPALEQAFWGSTCMELTDPFGNKLLFSEPST